MEVANGEDGDKGVAPKRKLPDFDEGNIAGSSGSVGSALSVQSELRASGAGLIRQAKRACPEIPEIILSLLQNRYDSEYDGPFEIFLEKIGNNTASASDFSVSELRLGKQIGKVISSLWKCAHDLKHLGNNKFSVSMPGYLTANKLVEVIYRRRNEIFKDETWVAYVPNHKIYRTVITHDLDPSISEEEVFNNLGPVPRAAQAWRCPVKVQNIRKRVTSENDPSKTTFINTKSFIVTFPYTATPSSAIFYGKRIYFSPYVQRVRRCDACQRYGHVSSLCRGGDGARVCARCASKDHHASECTSKVLTCINCIRTRQQDCSHAATDVKCPVFQENRKMKIIMAKLNLSPRDARAYFVRYMHLLNDEWFDLRSDRAEHLGVVLSDYMKPSFASACASNSGLHSPPDLYRPSCNPSPNLNSVTEFPSLGQPLISSDKRDRGLRPRASLREGRGPGVAVPPLHIAGRSADVIAGGGGAEPVAGATPMVARSGGGGPLFYAF